MNKRLFSIVLLFVIAVSMTACTPALRSEPSLAMPAAAPMMPETSAKDTYGSTAPQSESPASGDRIVIKNAELNLVVLDPETAIQAISALAGKYAGFVVDSNSYKRTNDSGQEVTVGNISIRVASERLDQVLAEIKALVEDPKTDIKSENVRGEDVTSQYTDLQSRLRNLEATSKKLTEIMEEAKKTEDVLAVFHELTSINEQIEVIKGQLKYYDESARLSAVSVELTSKAEAKPLSIGSWQPGGVAKSALQALINTIKVIGNVIIWIVLYVLPVLIILAIPIFILYLIFRNRKKKVKPVVESKPKE